MYIILNKQNRSLSKCSWFCWLENRSVSAVTCSWHGPDNWKFDPVLSEQVRLWSSDVISFSNYCSSNYWNCISWSSVVTSHIHMKLAYSTIQWNISVLLIHVVDTSSWLISKDDSECLNMVGSSFKNFVHWKDLSLSGFCFKLSSEMIPEFRFSYNLVGSK